MCLIAHPLSTAEMTTPIRSYLDQQAFVKAHRQHLDLFYTFAIPTLEAQIVHPDDHNVQHFGDVTIYTSDRLPITVEEKVVRQQYDSIFYELKDGNADGCMLTTKAEMLCYAFHTRDGLLCYLWPMSAVRRCYEEHKGIFSIIRGRLIDCRRRSCTAP